MAKFDADDLGMQGYFLPEDSQFRLRKLREYLGFLSRLAQPRTWTEEQDEAPEISMMELEICLQLLAEQVGIVLDEVSWPARRHERTATLGSDAEPDATEEVPDDASDRYIFGATLEQVDTLQRLIEMISAHADAMMASRDAEFAEHTLSSLGRAISDGARAMRETVSQVESQRLERARRSQAGVGEERAAYDAVCAWPVAEGRSCQALPLPAYPAEPGPEGRSGVLVISRMPESEDRRGEETAGLRMTPDRLGIEPAACLRRNLDRLRHWYGGFRSMPDGVLVAT